MTRRPATARRGITLTEILISILIMGVGLISLATLFPLGMVRLRDANRQHRSALLGESATADLAAMGLLYKPYFFQSWYGGAYDPFTQDPGIGIGLSSPIKVTDSNSILPFPQNQVIYSYTTIPVCYDPLWWYVAGPKGTSGSTVTPGTTKVNGEFRFGQGVFLLPSANTFLRTDPVDKGTPAGHGLQRITNFNPALPNWKLTDPTTVFVSPDDVVMQNSDAAPQVLGGPTTSTNNPVSGVVPQMSGLSPLNDWRYTWLFTGAQVDVTNGTVYTGNVVVMDSRPLAVDKVASPTSATGASSPTAAGEIVMEAIFGYSANTGGSSIGFGVAADRTVLLRWPTAMVDPEIKVGNWIADVTYQRDPQRIADLSALNGGSVPMGHPLQRCNWYQVAKRSDVQEDPDVAGYRRVVLTINTPVKDRTLLYGAGSGKTLGTPVVLNVALFMPSVVNVFQRTAFVRTDR